MRQRALLYTGALAEALILRWKSRWLLLLLWRSLSIFALLPFLLLFLLLL
jgi:hypothetical protein